MGFDCADWLCRECDVCEQECSLDCEMCYKRKCSDCFLFDSCYPKD